MLLKSRSESPLVEIIEQVVKNMHLLGRTERSKYLREFYIDRFHSSGTRSSNGTLASSKKSEYYRGCQLPLVSRHSTETVSVKTWIETLFYEKALISVVEVYDICKQHLSSHATINCDSPVSC